MDKKSGRQSDVLKWDEGRIRKAERIFSIVQGLISKQNGVILDVGCHEGAMEEIFTKNKQKKIIGIDISLDTLKSAQLKFQNGSKNIEFVNADGLHLPFKKDVVECIICNHVIDYLEPKGQLISEFMIVLKENGYMYLAVINMEFLKWYLRFPKFFKIIVGPFYGRVKPSFSSKFGTPEKYQFWQDVLSKRNRIKNSDITANIILKNDKNILKETTLGKILRKILSKISPSWVFIAIKSQTEI